MAVARQHVGARKAPNFDDIEQYYQTAQRWPPSLPPRNQLLSLSRIDVHLCRGESTEKLLTRSNGRSRLIVGDS